MTSFRSALVKGKHLAEISRELDLGKYLFLSRGEEQSDGREKKYILANTVEALIAEADGAYSVIIAYRDKELESQQHPPEGQ